MYHFRRSIAIGWIQHIYFKCQTIFKNVPIKILIIAHAQQSDTKQLKQNGIPISEDIPYEVAKDKISEITEKMKELQTSDDDPKKVQFQYFKLEEEF